MKTIWKFPLQLLGVQDVEMPRGSKILSANSQRGVLCVWAMVSPDAETEQRRFYVIGTGYPITDTFFRALTDFIGTVQFDYGSLIYHVFVEGRK